MKETMLMMTPPKNAHQKPFTWKEGTKAETRRSRSAFTTKVNSPSVTIKRGSERISMIGRKKALKIPSNSDAANSVRKSSA